MQLFLGDRIVPFFGKYTRNINTSGQSTYVAISPSKRFI